MHQQCCGLLAEVRGSRTRAPNMHDTDPALHAVATFTKGAYLAKSLEESTPFFFNAARMASTVEWIGAGNDKIAAALLSSLCRDHERTLEDVEAAYVKFSHSHKQISTLSADVHSIAQLTLTTVYNGVEATSTRLHSPPVGPWAAVLVLVFMLGNCRQENIYT